MVRSHRGHFDSGPVSSRGPTRSARAEALQRGNDMFQSVSTGTGDDAAEGGSPDSIIPASTAHRLLLPHAALWVESAHLPARLASACTAILLEPGRAIRTELVDPTCRGVDLVELPPDLWSRVRGAMIDVSSGPVAERWPWSWLHIDAAHYAELRVLRRQDRTDDALLASWICAQLRRSIADWRKAAMRTARSQRTAPSGQLSPVQAVAREIARRWREGATLQRLADDAGMSVFHLLRSFRSVHGLTPHKFLLQLRLRRALHWLDEGRLSGAALAERTGFCSHGHFCAAFRGAFGMTPSGYLARRPGGVRPVPHPDRQSRAEAPRTST